MNAIVIFFCKKTLCLSVFVLVTCSYSYGQIAIGGDKVPKPNTDLTLGSDNKGALLNRVKLESFTSAAPLDAVHIKPGMIVYNTNVSNGLLEGVYYWTSMNKWSRIYVKVEPTREMSQLVFKETTKVYDVTYRSLTDIDELDYTYKATMNGTVFLELTFYAAFDVVTSPRAGNTFAVTKVLDKDNNDFLELSGDTAMSPYAVASQNGGDMPVQGYSNFTFPVKKGHTYTIKTTAKEVFTNTVVRFGNYTVGDHTLRSSMKVTLLSDPKL